MLLSLPEYVETSDTVPSLSVTTLEGVGWDDEEAEGAVLDESPCLAVVAGVYGDVDELTPETDISELPWIRFRS